VEKTKKKQINNPDPYEDMIRSEKLDPYEALIKLNRCLKKSNKLTE